MTQLLEQAFVEAAKLSDDEQNALATILLEELNVECRWNDAFAHSQDKLAQLATGALTKHQAGRTKLLDVNEL